MSIIVETAHGHQFCIDTMDWKDEEARERCESGLIEIVASFTAEQASDLHSLLTQAQNGDIEWDTPKLSALQDRCNAARDAATADWASQPDLGHNAEIAAA